MFRTQQNIFDDAVGKATDENLTSENWEYILDVCDRASSEASGPKDVVQALIKRMGHRNANVQLYTLELANALSQNCGAPVHRELASRSFTDALLRLAADRTTHSQVKAKILERMAAWARMFAANPDLGIMEQAYTRLKAQNPNLHPPDKPQKSLITEGDRRKEEEELALALELSVKEKGGAASSTGQVAAASVEGGSEVGGGGGGEQELAAPISSSGTTAATVNRVRALFDFQPSEPGELQFKKGDVIAVLESVYRDWWKGSLRGQTGIFPLNYVERLADPTREELAREALMEAEVFAEVKNVEKLLALLGASSSNGEGGGSVRDNEEITALYHGTLAIRPKLIELIGKYSQRKDDFTQLNEKFIKARRDYENLLDQSMAQPPASAYGHGHGRPAQPQPYGFPPAGYPAQGPAPAPSEPGRYYSPRPQDAAPPQPLSSNPPRTGPAPFYLAGQLPAAAAQAPPSSTPYPRASIQTPRPGQAPAPAPQQQPSDPYSRRPESTYDNPQEIGTSYTQAQGYPQQPPPHQQQQQQQHAYSAYGAQAPPPQQQQAHPPQPGHLPHQDSYPNNMPAPSPTAAYAQANADVPQPLNPHGYQAQQAAAQGPPPPFGQQAMAAPQEPGYAPPVKPPTPGNLGGAYPQLGGTVANPQQQQMGGQQQQQQQAGYQAGYQAYKPPEGNAGDYYR